MSKNISELANITNNRIDSEHQIFILAFLTLLYGTISLIAVIGNSLIIYTVIINKTLQSVTNYFICNLAVADLIIGLLVAPFQVFHRFIFLGNSFEKA